MLISNLEFQLWNQQLWNKLGSDKICLFLRTRRNKPASDFTGPMPIKWNIHKVQSRFVLGRRRVLYGHNTRLVQYQDKTRKGRLTLSGSDVKFPLRPQNSTKYTLNLIHTCWVFVETLWGLNKNLTNLMHRYCLRPHKDCNLLFQTNLMTFSSR